MKSYVLAVALAMLVAAGFVFQNPGTVTVRFLMWSRELPQGVWEVALFAAGAVLMWGVSLVAMMEERNRYRREIRDLDRRVTELREERDSLVTALKSFGPVAEKESEEIIGDKVESMDHPGDGETFREPAREPRIEEAPEKGIWADMDDTPEEGVRKWIPSWLSRKKKAGQEPARDDWGADLDGPSLDSVDEEEKASKEKEGDPDLF